MKRKLHLILFAVIAMFLLSGCVTEGDKNYYTGEYEMVMYGFGTCILLMFLGAFSNPILLYLTMGEEQSNTNFHRYSFFCLTLMFTLYFGYNLYLKDTIEAYYPFLIGLPLGVLIVQSGYKNPFWVQVLDLVVWVGSLISFSAGFLCLFVLDEASLYDGRLYYWVWVAILAITVIGCYVYTNQQMVGVVESTEKKGKPKRNKPATLNTKDNVKNTISKEMKEGFSGWGSVWFCEELNMGYKLNRRTKTIQIFNAENEVISENKATSLATNTEAWEFVMTDDKNDSRLMFTIEAKENSLTVVDETTNGEIDKDSTHKFKLIRLK